MAMEKRVGFVGILVEDRGSVPEVNKVLTDYSRLILARLGLPRSQETTAVITLVVEANTDEIGALAGRLGKIKGVAVKSALARAAVAPTGAGGERKAES